MKDKDNIVHRFSSISDLHRMLGLPKPLHPMVSLVDNTHIAVDKELLPATFLLDFYKISYKTSLHGKIRYGQHYYDFDEGGLIFTSPNQVLATSDETEYLGHTLLFHIDFIRNHPLAKDIKNYGFFSYTVNEALHLSDKEKQIVFGIFRSIEDELQSNIDDFSQDVIISQIELLLNYSQRFYNRQFITRKNVSNDILDQLEKLVNDYYNEAATLKGLPSVQHFAEQLSVSPRYLSDMLRSLTGHSAQHYIQDKLLEKAKEMLSTTSLSVSEIAYHLGFEYPQSFNKLFKNKMAVSPLEFRQSFN